MPEGGSLVLFYSGTNAVLQSTTNLLAPFTNTDIKANPAIIDPTNAQTFFRLSTNQ
jgi:hypothetical protein